MPIAIKPRLNIWSLSLLLIIQIFPHNHQREVWFHKNLKPEEIKNTMANIKPQDHSQVLIIWLLWIQISIMIPSHKSAKDTWVTENKWKVQEWVEHWEAWAWKDTKVCKMWWEWLETNINRGASKEDLALSTSAQFQKLIINIMEVSRKYTTIAVVSKSHTDPHLMTDIDKESTQKNF